METPMQVTQPTQKRRPHLQQHQLLRPKFGSFPNSGALLYRPQNRGALVITTPAKKDPQMTETAKLGAQPSPTLPGPDSSESLQGGPGASLGLPQAGCCTGPAILAVSKG